MRGIEKTKSGRLRHVAFFLILFIGAYLAETPVHAHTPEFLQRVDLIVIKGVVKDVHGETVIGATVRSKSNKFAGSTTGVDGDFIIYVASMEDVLIFNYVGMEQLEVPLKPETTFYNVVMKTSMDTQLKDVVVEAGIIQHNKLGFTGSYTSVSKDQLKSIGNMNILQSLSAFDPGFNLIQNSVFGSNPNVMATIELRGQNSLDLDINTIQDEAAVNRNQPLFILDGFEATLEEINDLNINIIESITILKDAGSTAIYGAKGGNGVIIIETIKPTDGKIMVRYDMDLQLSAADLSVYNMMNAAEKLEFERLSERYGDITDTENLLGQEEYYRRLRLVKSGVDTYWLKEPVRTGFSHSHSVNVTGGNKGLLFLASINYRNTEGVMKGSKRESYTGNFKLTYRGIDGLNISNNLSVQGTNAYDGSWGNFQDFVNANPYYSKTDEYGNIHKVLDSNFSYEEMGRFSSYNPLYNAMLNSRNDKNTFVVRNNTGIDWFVNDHLRLKGSLALYRETNRSEKFTDPDHSTYVNTDYTKKGEYASSFSSRWKYTANATAIYSRVFAKHSLTGNLRYEVSESNYTSESIKAYGFPIGAPGVPMYAYSYEEDSRPAYYKTVNRYISLLGAINYNYDFRYLFDVSFNREGSNTFGNKNKFTGFWSAGLGWNIHKELFAEDWEWLDFFKIRGTIGTNANQNLSSSITTSSIYNYVSGNNIFGLGSYLANFGNPYFEWEKVKKKSVGLDIDVFDRFGLKFDLYENVTDPQATYLPVPSSSGMKSYVVNAGWVNTKGLEFTVTYSPIKNIKENIYLTFVVNGEHLKSKYGGFEDSLSQLNDDLLDVKDNPVSSLRKFEDGRSPDDLWAVTSLGIDPATGREVFRKQDGSRTYQYSADDREVIASSRPDVRGNVMVNFKYKKFLINMAFAYSIGGYRLNSALYNKVENISDAQIIYNQDKRALYDRWKEPGDIAQFKAVNLLDSKTPISSRFIQKDNYLQGRSIQLSWDFSRDKWITVLGMQSLTMGLSMTDIFTWSTIKVERATNYPFQRAVAFNLSTRF